MTDSKSDASVVTPTFSWEMDELIRIAAPRLNVDSQVRVFGFSFWFCVFWFMVVMLIDSFVYCGCGSHPDLRCAEGWREKTEPQMGRPVQVLPWSDGQAGQELTSPSIIICMLVVACCRV
jgi:hypothetical protein